MGGSEGCLGPDLRVWVARTDAKRTRDGTTAISSSSLPRLRPDRAPRKLLEQEEEQSGSEVSADPAGTPGDALRCTLTRLGSGFTLGVLTGSRQGLGRLVQEGDRKAVVAVLLWDRAGTRVGGPRAGTLPHLPTLTQQPIGGQSWMKLGRQRPLAGIRKCLRPQHVGVWAGRWGTRGRKLNISTPDTSPQSPMARPPAASSLAGLRTRESVPPRGLGVRISSFPDTEDRRPHWPRSGRCLPVTHLVPPMNLSSGSHLTRSSPRQGTFWRRPSSLGDNWCRVPRMWSPMETRPESEKGPTSWAAPRGHCLCPREFPHSPCF